MSSAIAGPSMSPTTTVSKKHGKEHKKKSRLSATSSGKSGDEGDASALSTDSRREEKRRRKEEKKAAKWLAKQNAIEGKSDADADAVTKKEKDEEHRIDVRNFTAEGSAQSAFRTITSIVDLPIPPALCQNPRKAAGELIDTMLMRYVPQFGGVLICHTECKFLKTTAVIDADGAFSVAPTRLTCLVWAPYIGMRLEGRVTLSTASHVSLLVHGIFNASITSAHLPSLQEATDIGKQDGLTWREFPVDAEDEAMQEDGDDVADYDGAVDADFNEKSTGYWENAAKGERLGGTDGIVVFTVVGMTIANHMLSIHGSLLRKPFSIPAPTYVPTTKEQREAAVAAATAESTRRVRFQEELNTPEYTSYAAMDDSDDDEDENEVDAAAANVVTPIEVQTVNKPVNGTSSKKRRSTGKDGPDDSLDGEKRSKKKSKKA